LLWLKTAIASAMSDYPIGDLIAERVRAMGVKPFYKHFKHDGVTGPNMATVYSDRGTACARRWCSTTAATRRRRC
jgi:2-dehydro-3-deoxygluconokinase